MNTKSLKERYVVDENGDRVGVLLDIADYRKILEELEELESIRAYDAAKASGDEAIPFEQAIDEIKKAHKGRKLLLTLMLISLDSNALYF